MTYGVPQGSILDPLLFLVYVNDFKSCLKNFDAIKFADDTKISATNKSLPALFDLVNKELTIVDDWLIANKSSLMSQKLTILFSIHWDLNHAQKIYL